MPNYAMVIDLDSCVCCNACTMACKAEHGTQPGVFWGHVLEKEFGKTPRVARLFLPVLCNHCEDPPCEDACPTGATYVENGVVLVDYDKCIGCKSCITACPYNMRWYIDKERYYFPDTPIPYGVDELRGQERVVQKCTLCSDRLKEGKEPRCVQVCPTYCRTFGDLDDPTSEVSKLLQNERTFTLRPELGTKPRVHYILTKNRDVIRF